MSKWKHEPLKVNFPPFLGGVRPKKIVNFIAYHLIVFKTVLYYTLFYSKIWTLIPLICKWNTFFLIPGKMTKNSYKIIMSLYHSFEGDIILH
jgi:hypothetical protein